jgi:signal transduction histidine kinase
VRRTLALSIANTNARIVCEPLPAVEPDPVLLERLLQNLVANAIQYRRPEEAPVIEISCEPAGEGWQFAVKDNGQGIPGNHQDDIFEPLKRLHGSETPGSGLGLALCRTIGRRIWVESEGSGHGAIFRFTLSASQESPPLFQSSSVA